MTFTLQSRGKTLSNPLTYVSCRLMKFSDSYLNNNIIYAHFYQYIMSLNTA